MSLVSLTFGNDNGKRNRFSVQPEIEVIQPWHHFHEMAGIENRLLIKKVCSFYKRAEMYLIGEIVSGVVKEGMKGKINGKEFKVLELESKMKGAPIAGQGMTIGLTIDGISYNEIQKNNVVIFEN